MMIATFVIPAKAGIHRALARPAPTMDCSAHPCASPELRSGIGVGSLRANQSRFRGNDKPGEIRATWLGY